MNRVMVLTAVLLATSGNRAFSDDSAKVDLRGPSRQVGQTFRSTIKFDMKDADLTLRVEGTKQDGKMSVSGESVIEKTIVAMDGRSVIRFRTKHLKDESKSTTTIGGEEDEDDDVNDLAGAVVLSEKIDGQWRHRLQDAEPTTEQEKALKNHENWDDDDDIPEGMHPVGTTWDIDATHLRKILGNDFGSVSGGMKGKFVRLEEYGGESCAVIEATGRIKGKSSDGLLYDMNLNVVEYRSVAHGFAVKTSATGTFQMSGTVKEAGLAVKLSAKGPIVSEEQTELKK